MNSFWVPQLGGQIYTMAGMVTRLNLQADHLGSFPGRSAQYSGAGFSGMRFTVDAIPADKFGEWVTATRGAGPVLDAQTYQELVKPTQSVAPFTFRDVAPGLFNSIVSSVSNPPAPSSTSNPASQRAER
jgi:cytochrome o ubiquinol oxidase subunit 2